MHRSNTFKDITRRNVETVPPGFDARLNYFHDACDRMRIVDHVASAWVLVIYPLVLAIAVIAFLGCGNLGLVR
jgi:hypothetical protein